MPLRSPKRNFFIFGFQRFVWWPKCTPASNNSLIETTPIPSPPLKARRAPTGEGECPLILKPSDVSDVDVYFDNFPLARFRGRESLEPCQKPWNVSTMRGGLQGSI